MKGKMKKYIATFGVMILIAGSIATYAVVNNEENDGDISYNPWGEKFTTTEYQPPETTTEKPAIDETTAEETITDETTTEEPTANETTAEETITNETTEKSSTDETITNETTDKPTVVTTTDASAADETTTIKTSIEETTTGEVSIGQTTTAFDKTETTLQKHTTQADSVKIARAKIKKATRQFKAKKAKISIKKIKGVGAYKVQVSSTKKFKKAKTVTKTYKKTKIKFNLKRKKLNGKKKLYVRARAYKKVNGVVYWGNWSAVKKIRIKKLGRR